MMKLRKDGFTLIEMLVVIVIIAIVLAITIPSITGLMKSGGLSAASRQVANSLSLARQYAITHRTVTRVVFPFSLTATGTNVAPWYQSYAVIDIGSTNYLSKWEFLPLGTVFMDQSLSIFPTPPCLNNLKTDTLPFPYTNSTPLAILAYIEFQPTGAASNPGSLTITEGFLNNGTTPPTVLPTSKTTSNTIANQSLISVDNIIGRIQVTRP
jgi:prepilin-type N-terminal cleavage/methylation domain-containing protein